MGRKPPRTAGAANRIGPQEPRCSDAATRAPGTFTLVTLELGPDDKRMRLRYAGTCRPCGRPHEAGGDAIDSLDVRAGRDRERRGGVAQVVDRHAREVGENSACMNHEREAFDERGRRRYPTPSPKGSACGG